MGFNECKVAVLGAGQGASTNGLSFPLLVHAVSMRHADGSAQAAVDLYDAATATGTAVVSMEANLADGTTYETHQFVQFNPPLAFETGLSHATTNSPSTRVYYNRR